MNILYVCSNYHNAMIYRDSMNALIQIGNHVQVFSFAPYGTTIDEKFLPIMDDLVTHKECFYQWERYLFISKQLKIYRQLLKSYHPDSFDIIHSHNLFSGGYATYKISKRFHTPYVVSIRNTDIYTFMRFKFFHKIAYRILSRAGAVVFLSHAYKDFFFNQYIPETERQIFEQKCYIIPNGLEPFWLENKSGPKVWNRTQIRLLSVNTIDRNKNITTTVKTCDILNARGYQVELTVIGTILDDAVFHEITASKYVRYREFMKKEDLLPLYQEHDIFIMPSRRETFGRVYAEAMTQGLPVIYTTGQGFDGYFDDGFVGFSVPYDNPDYIADCIEKILNNYNEISSNCVAASGTFNWDLISNNLQKSYQHAIDSIDARI